MQVVSCHIIKHRDTQKPRGCFVEFETLEDLEKALKKDGSVSLSQPSATPCTTYMWMALHRNHILGKQLSSL